VGPSLGQPDSDNESGWRSDRGEGEAHQGEDGRDTQGGDRGEGSGSADTYYRGNYTTSAGAAAEAP